MINLSSLISPTQIKLLYQIKTFRKSHHVCKIFLLLKLLYIMIIYIIYNIYIYLYIYLFIKCIYIYISLPLILQSHLQHSESICVKIFQRWFGGSVLCLLDMISVSICTAYINVCTYQRQVGNKNCSFLRGQNVYSLRSKLLCIKNIPQYEELSLLFRNVS